MMYEILSTQLNETKDSLKSVEESIRRITGRDPDSFTPAGSTKWKKDGIFPAKQGNFQSRKRTASSNYDNEKKALSLEEEEEDEEESPDEDVLSKKPAVQSAIVATHKIVKTRMDTLAEQKGDKRNMARNRRMFGMILGTLEKFQNEESRRKNQASKRAEIDKKVEEATEKEKELMKKEKQELFVSRKNKQVQIRCLEKKLEIAEIHEVWEKNHQMLRNFIQTTAKPQIMFLPAKHNAKSLKSLQKTQEGITTLIIVKRKQLEQELAEIEECYRRDAQDLDSETNTEKENFGPDEEQESNRVTDDADATEMKVDQPQEEKQQGDNLEVISNQDSSMDFVESMDNPDEQTSNSTDHGEPILKSKSMDDHDEFEPIYD